MNNRTIINERASPTYLAKSEDPRKRMSGDTVVTNHPLSHTTSIYGKGMQQRFGGEGLTDEEIKRL